MNVMKGVYSICPTPFTHTGALDLDSLRRLVDFQHAVGIDGLAILGFLGEAHKLSAFEQRRVIETVISRNAGRVPVWVGIRALGLAGAIEQSRNAESLGANALFVAPLDNASDDLLFTYYSSIAKAVKIPIIIHDFPASFGTKVSAELVARLGNDGGVNAIKMEEPPVGPKITRIRQLAGENMKVFGGLGGVYFQEELDRGAVGTMTGFAFPEILLRIYNLHASGDTDGALKVFNHYAPLLRYEFQPSIGLALRKYIYMKRGVIATDFARSPHVGIDDITRLEVDRVVNSVGLSLQTQGVQAVI